MGDEWIASRGLYILYYSWACSLGRQPDHGFPLRVVIPGQIGGRSVKWLSNIEISARESQHYLHFWVCPLPELDSSLNHDCRITRYCQINILQMKRVLPKSFGMIQSMWAFTSSQMSLTCARYIITELNTNSAIAYPDHDETIALDSLSTDASYTLKGCKLAVLSLMCY